MLATQLAEDIFRIYSGGDPSDESGLELADFEDAVQSARAFKIKLDYWQSMKIEGERVINQTWIENFDNVPVVQNETTKAYYSVLPKQVFGDLPKGRGMYLICRPQDFTNPFMPMRIGEQWLFSTLPQDDTISYYFDSTTVTYVRFDPDIESVFMAYVPLNSDVIPDEVAHEISELVLNKFLKPKQIILQDKLTNNNPNKVETDVAG